MMTIKLQLIIAIALILGLIVIFRLIYKRKLELRYSLIWIIAILFVLVMDCFPILLNNLSFAMGIWSPVNMIFFLGFCFSLVIIFVLTVIVSKMSEKIRKLTQAVALNEEKIEMLLNEEQAKEKEE